MGDGGSQLHKSSRHYRAEVKEIEIRMRSSGEKSLLVPGVQFRIKWITDACKEFEVCEWIDKGKDQLRSLGTKGNVSKC